MPHHYNFTRSNSSSTSIDLTIATILTELSILQLKIKNPEAIIDDPHELGYRLENILEDLKVINRALPALGIERDLLIDRHQLKIHD
jgi:hypothetical protein